MKFKHIKYDCWKYSDYTKKGCKFTHARHLKNIKVWDYEDEIMFQVKNGHSTKGLRYKMNKCDVPYNTKWYRKISSNRKLIKEMCNLRAKYKEVKKAEDSFKSQIKIYESKSCFLHNEIKHGIKQLTKENK